MLTGDANDKSMIIERGLDPGELVYLDNPVNPEKFRLMGRTLYLVIRERERMKRAESNPSAMLQGAD